MLSLPWHAPEWHMREAPRRWAGEATFAAGCRASGMKFYRAVSPSRRTYRLYGSIAIHFQFRTRMGIIAFIAGESRAKVHIHALTERREPGVMLPTCPHMNV